MIKLFALFITNDLEVCNPLAITSNSLASESLLR